MHTQEKILIYTDVACNTSVYCCYVVVDNKWWLTNGLTQLEETGMGDLDKPPPS